MIYQAKQAKLTEEPPEPSNRTIADQQGDVGKSPMVDLRIRLPDGQVKTCNIYLTMIMCINYVVIPLPPYGYITVYICDIETSLFGQASGPRRIDGYVKDTSLIQTRESLLKSSNG